MPALSFLEKILIFYLTAACGGLIAFVYIIENLKELRKKDTQSMKSLHDHLETTRNQLQFMQQKLNETNTNATYETLFDKVNFGFILLNGHCEIISINPYTQQLLGYSKLDVLLKPLDSIVTLMDDQKKTISITPEQLQSNKPTKFLEWIHLSTSRINIPISAVITPLPLSGGMQQIAIIFWDQTDRNEEHEQLKIHIRDLEQKSHEYEREKQNNEYSASTMENIYHAILVINKNEKIVFCNPYAQRLIGSPQSELFAQQYSHVLPLKDKQDKSDYSSVIQAFTGHPTPLSKWTFLSTRNGPTPITGMVSPIQKNGYVSDVILSFTDATDTYAQESQEKAFFSSAAHDLRTPLTTIRTISEYLESSFDKLSKDQVREMLAGTKQSAIHLIMLINDLLNVSRIELGKIELTKESFDIIAVTRNVIENMQVTAKQKKLSMYYDLTYSSLPKVLGDKNKTIDILTNLISNAIKYTSQGQITIYHHLGDTTVETSVKDTGVGISPENQPLLFHKYQQVGTSRKFSVTKSTGLGLYISKTFAVLMDGDLTLERSEPGVGSIFTFRIPIAPP